MRGPVSHTTVKPVRLRTHSTELCCDVSSVKAYRAYCACGWSGPFRGKVEAARVDGRAHRQDCVE